MSKRSEYLRDQAAKCEVHARAQTAAEIQAQLRSIASQYLEQAVVIEAKEAR